MTEIELYFKRINLTFLEHKFWILIILKLSNKLLVALPTNSSTPFLLKNVGMSEISTRLVDSG
jgi:hypothetical protein